MLLALALASLCVCLAEKAEFSSKSENSKVQVMGIRSAKNDTFDLVELLKHLETEETHNGNVDIVKRQISSYPSYSSPSATLISICTCCNKISNQLTGLECCPRSERECFVPTPSSSYSSPSSYYLNPFNKPQSKVKNKRVNNKRRSRRNRQRQI